MPTGDIEVKVSALTVYSEADVLPIQVFGEDDAPEELRLKYRFLDLRKERIHNNIILRSKVIAEMRRLMTEQGFTEYQTPILTASSPEGARDFWFRHVLTPASFTLCRKPRNSLSNCLWFRALTVIFKLRRASAMKTRALTAARANFISLIWKCLLPRRKTCLKF